MPYTTMISNDDFWKFLVSLEELKAKKERMLFCSSLSISEEKLQEFVDFLNSFDVYCELDKNYIYPLKEKCKFNIELTLSEWLSLQASVHNEKSSVVSSYYHKIIETKIKQVEKAYHRFNLYRNDNTAKFENIEKENLIKKVDAAIVNKKIIDIYFYNNKCCKIYPHRLVYVDGILCAIGESIEDKTLVYFGIEDMCNVLVEDIEYEAHISPLEINEFIGHIRLINGKEERLVLKIYSKDKIDLLPQYHYLGNPFVTSNIDGDMIWAATLEMCDDLYQWLFAMKDSVEILDPGHIRREFAHYCELKKQTEVKKAS